MHAPSFAGAVHSTREARRGPAVPVTASGHAWEGNRRNNDGHSQAKVHRYLTLGPRSYRNRHSNSTSGSAGPATRLPDGIIGNRYLGKAPST